jgi:putative DNA primase/helicase
LIGEGSNGKSVLLKILEAMVGKENTSHIEIAFLNSEFNRIQLLGSRVNICNDMKSDVSGTESYLKAIVSGDPISGAKKFRDAINFSPYCKMVFSVNRMPTARDIDAALMRRFCFISFPVKFVDKPNPTKVNERMKIDSLDEILLKELPGIFNWALRGLKALREQGRFSEPADEKQSKDELYRLNNPIIAFVEDVVGNGGSRWTAKLSRATVYYEYNEWCKRTNTRPLSARGFWPRLREVFPMRETRGFDGWYVEFTEPRKYCGAANTDAPSSTSDECGENCGDPPF